MLHALTFMQSPLAKKHTQGPRLTEAAISAQFSAQTAFGCHEDDEVRGLGAEFDPDWHRQRWHNLYQSTSLLLDSLCLRVCVCVCPVKVRAFSLSQELRPAQRSVFLTFRVSVMTNTDQQGAACRLKWSQINNLSPTGPTECDSGHRRDDRCQQRNPVDAKSLQDPHQTKVRALQVAV